MTDVWSDPTAAGAIYVDPTAPVYIAPIMLTEPDPVYRDDALFASSSANWRPAPLPPPPIPILNEAGELVLVVEPPTPAELRTQAVDALHAPAPGGPTPVASRGGARSTYNAPASGGGRNPQSRPAGSVTSSPATWLPDQGSSVPPPPALSGWRSSNRRGPGRPNGAMPGGPLRNMPTPTVAWRAGPPTPTWQPAPLTAPTRPTTATWVPAGPPPGPSSFRTQARAARSTRSGRTGRTGRRKNLSWIPILIVLAFVVVANVAPHVGSWFSSHKAAPAAVTDAVNSYYSDLEVGNVSGADALICNARRTAFIAGSTDSDSDVGRNITNHTITSSSTAGSGKYKVHVNVSASNGSSGPATITVVQENGTYHLCGGTSP